MRILVEPSDYVLRNIGDIAMLRVAVLRLAEMWPEARIDVLTDEPDKLRLLFPQVIPLSSRGRRRWLNNKFLKGHKLAPRLAPRLELWLRKNQPQAVEIFWRLRLRRNPEELEALNAFTDAVAGADLVVVTGMGGIADIFKNFAGDLLETLALAVRRGKYVAMLGQGIGPLADPKLRERARTVLPGVSFFGLREQLASRPLLISLGAEGTRIAVTGDDAIQMAYTSQGDGNGDGIGVNLRAADYSGVDDSVFPPLRRALTVARESLGARLIPIEISHVPGEADAGTIRRLIDEEGPLLAPHLPESLQATIRQVQCCRIVVTGSYHAGVFALASGIPTIGLVRSPYYADKFLGLADQFGEGCRIVSLEDEGFTQGLERAMTDLWESAERLRPSLLASAEKQMRLGRDAYRRIYDEVTARTLIR